MKHILLAVLLCVASSALAAPVTPTKMSETERASLRAKGLAADKAATEKAMAQRAADDKAKADAAATQKAADEKLAADKVAAEKAATAKVAEERAAAAPVLYLAGAGGVALVALLLTLIMWRRAAALQAKLAPIADIEGKVAQLQADEARESATVAELRKSREELEATVKALTESLDLIDSGLYSPHFDFTTSDQYKRTLDAVYEQKKAMVKGGTAATCVREWAVDGSKAAGAKMTKQNIKVMLRAFNSEVEAAVANVTWSNVTTMESRIDRAFSVINKNGEANTISISQEYLALAQKELQLAYEYQRKKQDEREEQRRIREEMREEAKLRAECERAEKEAQDEALRYQRALAKAESALKDAHGEQMAEANAKVEELKAALAEALAKKERAIAQAQLTKTGHIYVISNIGAFGEHVYKIGMTRRLDPEERIYELGDASVPFAFDIHAMIKAEDAPALERAFHQKFSERAVNLVNPRKEFFRVSLTEVEMFAKSRGVTVEFTMLAEAREHRESEALRSRAQGALPRDPTPAKVELAS